MLVNIEKRYVYYAIAVLVILFGIGFGIAYVNPTTKVGHDASEVGPGIMTGPITITGGLTVQGGCTGCTKTVTRSITLLPSDFRENGAVITPTTDPKVATFLTLPVLQWGATNRDWIQSFAVMLPPDYIDGTPISVVLFANSLADGEFIACQMLNINEIIWVLAETNQAVLSTGSYLTFSTSNPTPSLHKGDGVFIFLRHGAGSANVNAVNINMIELRYNAAY